MISLSTPSINGNELAYVSEAVKSQWVSTAGPYVEDFSSSFGQWLGEDLYCVPCSSGTAALHLALLGVGVKPGDGVVVSTMSFIAPANAVVYCGATPIFIDSEAESSNLDPELVADLVHEQIRAGTKPAAIVVVHVYGHPANIGPIIEIAQQYDIPVIEDAAESLGATFNNRPVGTLGTVGAFSFNGNKMMTCGGGGMAVTRNKAIADRIRHLSTQSRKPGSGYEHDEVGFNYRMTNLAAAMGLGQLERLDEFVSARKSIAERYKKAFHNTAGICFMAEPHWGTSSYWLSIITVIPDEFGATRDELMIFLRKNNIETRPFWKPLHKQKPFKDARYIGSDISTKLEHTGLCLPSSAHLTHVQQDTIIDAIVNYRDEVTMVPKSARVS